MKKLLLLTLSLISVYGLKAQDHYSFSQRSANYVEMTSGTEVSPSEWDDFEVGISLPFAFEYFGVEVDTMFIADDGIFFTDLQADYISPHGEDPIARGAGQSPVTYRVDGTGNKRILKVQWPNISFYSIADSFPNDFVNYQVWFYEGTNVIEFHYGSSFITTGALADLYLTPNMMSLDGLKWINIEGNSPNYMPQYNDLNPNYLSANPPVNTIFVFTPGFPNGVDELVKDEQLSLYPVPAGAELNIESSLPMQKIHVYNAAGQKLSTHEVSGNKAEIVTDMLPAGVYFLEIHTTEGVINRKFSK
ncbi:MAG TPA: hypothetical protein DIW47_11070 [Bacteroidetes bacterium]|nr:hypothetical protein [Bacteroidota bacterium]